MPTITATFTFPKDVYTAFKKAVPERKMSAVLAEYMKADLSRKAMGELIKMRFSLKEARAFERRLRDADKAALKAIH